MVASYIRRARDPGNSKVRPAWATRRGRTKPQEAMSSRCTTRTGNHTVSAFSKDREAAGRRARGLLVSDVVVNGVHENDSVVG